MKKKAQLLLLINNVAMMSTVVAAKMIAINMQLLMHKNKIRKQWSVYRLLRYEMNT